MTVPVGVPLPGGVTATANVKVTGSPVTDGSGEWPTIEVAVPAGFTVWGVPGEALLLKFVLPA